MVEQFHPSGGLLPTPQTFVDCGVLVDCGGFCSSLLLAWLKAVDLVLGPDGLRARVSYTLCGIPKTVTTTTTTTAMLDHAHAAATGLGQADCQRKAN